MAKILLVEDDKSLREIYGVRLLAEGYDIVSAGDGEEALAMAIKERPQLIVSDVMMPKISGFDMLDILRSTTETKDIKVIMMTALSSEDQRQRGEQLGADRYLVKSQVGIEDVVRTVHEVLADAPIAAGAQNAFGSSAPSAVPRPAPTAVPPRSTEPPAVTPTPAQPAASQAPVTPQTVQPAVPVTPPVSQITAPAATTAVPGAEPANGLPASSLPQPTAPFSTPRPAGLADRIIQPLERTSDASEPLASLMDRELGQADDEPEPSVPVPEPTIATPLPTPPAVPPAPPMPGPFSQSPPSTSSVPQAGDQDHGISFEETPR